MSVFKSLLGAICAVGAVGCATADVREQSPPEPVNLNSYILLDRTGSMSNIWDEAIGSVNAYVGSVIEPDGGPDVINDITLSVFDAQDGLQFDTLRRNIDGEAWTEIGADEVSPRGMTPLFDAIGRIVTLAEADNPEKAVIVIMTDGHENASREFTREGVQEVLNRVEDKGWQVVFLGAEFANFGDAEAVGVGYDNRMAVSAGQLSQTMENLADKNRSYAQGLSDTVEFDAEDRAQAEEEDVIQRQTQGRSN